MISRGGVLRAETGSRDIFADRISGEDSGEVLGMAQNSAQNSTRNSTGTGVEKKRALRSEREGWPREKLFHHGPHVLSNAELIALLLGTGARDRTSVDIASRLLQGVASIRELAAQGVRDFTRIEGIGPGKAARIAAAFELGRGRRRPQSVPLLTYSVNMPPSCRT